MPLYSEEELKQLPRFSDLNEALQQPDQVIRLDIYGVKDAAGLRRIEELTRIQSLSISLSDVSQLLPRLGALQDLQELYLQACRISVFPDSILGLGELRSLHIGNNALREIPDDLDRLNKLKWLGFSQNELERVPACIGYLDQLETLGLSYNCIKSLPREIVNLQKLEWLFLDVNELASLPDGFDNLASLQGLSLNCNRLQSLPPTICSLKRLRHLSLKNNPFQSLPECLGELRLEKFEIEAGKRRLFMDWTYRHADLLPWVELEELKLFVRPDSRVYSPLLAAIEEAGASDCASIILAKARNAVKIETTEPDDYAQVGRSRFGGFPDLADPALFPKTDGAHWSFLGQINLAELAPFNDCLPPRGLLSFFIDSTDRPNGKVIFWEGDPQGLATVREGNADTLVNPNDDYTQHPHRLTFERFCSLPFIAPEGIDDDDQVAAYEQLPQRLVTPNHHINGWTYTQLESPQELAANELGGDPNEWVPLLQLGWDAKVGFCFWDAGTITFTIHQEDLRRRDFSKVQVSLESF